MKLMRNIEIKNTFRLFIIISFIFTVIAFRENIKYGVFTLTLCLIFLIIYMISMKMRYTQISNLSEDLNKILHGDDTIEIDTYSEGELAILKSEIYKMTIRMRDQQQKLTEDKVYLADSIADISHQIRTPLTSINLLVALLSDPNITQERKTRSINKIYSLLSKIDWLVTTLLKISKIDAQTVTFNKEEISMSDFINKSVEPVNVPMEIREQELVIETSGNFYGDISWTQEAITNIVKNCMEHTQIGGKITVKGNENALFTEIIISDNGPGISSEDLPHIFERFYKGKNSSDKSFGIGLAFSRMIVISQNGTIKVENDTPCGAKFTIRFYKGTV